MATDANRRRLTRQLADLIDTGLDLERAANGKARSAKIEGPGWTISYHLHDGQPGSEVIQFSLWLGARAKERFLADPVADGDHSKKVKP